MAHIQHSSRTRVGVFALIMPTLDHAIGWISWFRTMHHGISSCIVGKAPWSFSGRFIAFLKNDSS